MTRLRRWNTISSPHSLLKVSLGHFWAYKIDTLLTLLQVPRPITCKFAFEGHQLKVFNISETNHQSHFILHDWPDTDAKRILAAQKSAMTVNYSKLLIHEAVLDPKNPNSSQTTADLTMMSMVSASESKRPHETYYL